MPEDIKDMLRDVPTEELKEALMESHASLFEKEEAEETTKEVVVVAEPKDEDPKDEGNELSEAVARFDDATKEMKHDRFLMRAESKLGEISDKLPSPVVDRLRKRITDGAIKTVEDVEAAVSEAVETYDELRKAATPTIKPMREFVIDGEAGTDRLGDDVLFKGMVGLISGKRDFEGVRSFASLKEAYWHYKAARGETVNTFHNPDLARSILKEAAG